MSCNANSVISSWYETCWFNSKNNAVGLCVKLNYMWPVEMNWIPVRPTLFRAKLFGGFVAVAQVFMQHLRSINARSRTKIDTQVPPKAIRALYFRHFLQPTLVGILYCYELSISTANIPMAITRIMSTDFSSQMNAGMSLLWHETRWLSFISHSNQQAYFILNGTDNYAWVRL